MLVTVDDGGRWHPCRHPTQWATTDQTGRFYFPDVYVARRWALIFPPIERFSSSFGVCVGRDSASLTLAFTGMSSLRSAAPADTVRCIVWSAHGRWNQSCASPVHCRQYGSRDHPRQACSTLTEASIREGGAWASPSASGFYRLLLPIEDTDAQEALLQWVQRLDGGAERVVDSLELRLAPKQFQVERLEFRTDTGGTCITLRSAGRKAHWYSLGPTIQTTTLELGPPGQAVPRAECGRR